MNKWTWLFIIGLVFVGCKKEDNSTNQTSGFSLAARGKIIYQTRCIACHSSDPKQAGSLGPEVFGASIELLRARIVDGGYPAGYTPKRDTRLMVPIPDLAGEIENLRAYLNEK